MMQQEEQLSPVSSSIHIDPRRRRKSSMEIYLSFNRPSNDNTHVLASFIRDRLAARLWRITYILIASNSLKLRQHQRFRAGYNFLLYTQCMKMTCLKNSRGTPSSRHRLAILFTVKGNCDYEQHGVRARNLSLIFPPIWKKFLRIGLMATSATWAIKMARALPLYRCSIFSRLFSATPDAGEYYTHQHRNRRAITRS